MIGGNKIPFRSPCAGAADVPIAVIKGPPPAPVDAYGNTTQMKDHCGNTIGAKARLYQQDTCGNNICVEPDCSACPGGVDLIINTPEPPKIGDNTFVKTGTVQLIPTRKLGGKWAQAFKWWHGCFGWLHAGTGLDCATSLILSSIKYLTATYDVHFNNVRDFDGSSDSGALTGARTVNASSGEISSTLISTETITEYFSGSLPIVYYTNGGAGYNFTPFPAATTPFASGGTTKLDAGLDELHCGFPAFAIGASFGTLADYIASWNTGHPSAPMPVITDPNNYSGSASDTVFGVTETVSATFTRTDTTISWDFATALASDDPGAPLNHWSYSGSIILSDTHTATNAKTLAEAQSALWVLTDDSKYPFRLDSHTTVAPIVLRNETGPQSPIGFNTYTVDDYENPIANDTSDAPFSSGWLASPKWAQRAWFDPACYQWVFPAGQDQTTAAATDLILIHDGSILFGPLPAGYGQPVGGNPQGVFDKDHENWIRRNCTLGIGWTQEPESRGGFTPTFLPSNAQKWTDDFNATTLWPCAFVHADSNAIYLQKWSEIQIKRPSVNFARPLGPDKYLLDETAVFFMADNTSGVVTLKDTAFNTPTSLPFAADDIVGGASVGGFYVIDAIGTNTITLGAKLLDVPPGWTTPSRDQSACFGRLRYPTCTGMNFIDERAEIGGRVEVTAVNTIPATLTTATIQKYLSLDGPENCDIFDANMVLLANSVLTRIDDTHFTTTTGYASIATAKYITPHATKYKLADTRNKGDYVFRTWLLKLADSSVLAHSQIDACLAFNPCGPSIVTITPNGETPPNGHRHDFPATINNGEVWLGQVQFWMIDPFWQQPHTPVAIPDSEFVGGTDIIIWREDDGGCAADSFETGGGGETIYHLFYAHRPYVEARCTLPTIDGEVAPAPLDGADITAIPGPVAQASIGDAEGPLINAIVIPTPNWVIYAAEKACVDAAGRFSNDYRANGT